MQSKAGLVVLSDACNQTVLFADGGLSDLVTRIPAGSCTAPLLTCAAVETRSSSPDRLSPSEGSHLVHVVSGSINGITVGERPTVVSLPVIG